LYTLLTYTDLQLSITKATGSAVQTKLRWNKFQSLAEPVIAGIEVEPRFFAYDFRQRLYEAFHTCQLCKNEIHSLEDRTMDHIIPYSKGGKTTPNNGQLAHRACNASKNNLIDLA
jgi:5-methylcytosine-specific restriction endonuclease McrA